MSKLEKTLLARLGRPRPSAAALARYVGARGHQRRAADEQSHLVYLGLSAKELRAVDLPTAEWAEWLTLFRSSSVYEVRSLALDWIGARAQTALRQRYGTQLFSLAASVDNWAHSDEVSALLAEQIEWNPALFSRLVRWSRSNNPWLRRQSVVAIYYYARMRKVLRSGREALDLVLPLLDDPHFYVQRGGGWCLREVYRVDPRRQRRFVRQNLSRISSTAWFAATELYPRL